MGQYHSMRVWQLKPGQMGADLENLTSTGFLEMQRWIPGVKHIALLRAAGAPHNRYVLTTTFDSYEAYVYWRQVEEEAPDYWERYAAIIMQWEQVCQLVDEYVGEIVLEAGIDAI